MRKTTLAIDDNVIRQVAGILGTSGIKDTVDAALRELIAANARERFAIRLREMRGLDLNDPEVMAGAWR